MITEDDARNTLEYDEYFAILPSHDEMDIPAYNARTGGIPCPTGFRYASDTNPRWLSLAELRDMIGVNDGPSNS